MRTFEIKIVATINDDDYAEFEKDTLALINSGKADKDLIGLGSVVVSAKTTYKELTPPTDDKS